MVEKQREQVREILREGLVKGQFAPVLLVIMEEVQEAIKQYPPTIVFSALSGVYEKASLSAKELGKHIDDMTT